MDIVIPLGGKGERFAKQGFLMPKPLLRIGHKELIRHVVDHLVWGKDDTLTFLYHEPLDRHGFSDMVRQHYPCARLVPIPFQTRGAVETLDYGLRTLHDDGGDRPCLLVDGDAFYTQDIVSMARGHKNGVFVFQEETVDSPARFSYVSLQDGPDRVVADIAEKSRIGPFANTGAYLFENRNTLLTYTQKVMDQDFRFCNEFYTSCAIKAMLLDHHVFHALELPRGSYVSLGTPEQVQDYFTQHAAFLLDLDGTLVDTTDVYVGVWDTLLAPYHVRVDRALFHTFIDGNSDEMAVRTLIPHLGKDGVAQLSLRKDDLFLERLHHTRVVEGALAFLEKVHREGHFLGVVTNCNRRVAEEILRYCGMISMVDVLVIGNECDHPKPYPDPYQAAKEQSGFTRVVVFEDSKTGLLSARGISPHCIVGIRTQIQDETVLRQHGAHRVVDNFQGLSPTDLLTHPTDPVQPWETMIRESVSGRFPHLDRVSVFPHKLKGGYIADVVRVDLVLKTGETIACIAKLQSETTNSLSDMAAELGLHEREQYFYESIRDAVQVRAPRYYGTIRNQDHMPQGILLEYLPPPDYRLGLDLEKEPLDLTLCLVRKLASHHARFWGKDLTRAFPQLKTNLAFPGWGRHVRERWGEFQDRWRHLLTPHQLGLGQRVVGSFDRIQNHLSQDPLTLCHGDVKSPNIFFHQQEPYLIDWQYITAGKGVQDLVFLMVESFSVAHTQNIGNLLKDYYYLSLQEEGVSDYSREAYEQDFQASIGYFPFFVAIWFGTTPPSQLIDVNFPFFFIQKLFAVMETHLQNFL